MDVLQQLVAGNPAALTAYQALVEAGGEVYIVGGAVRDAIMGKQPKDIDMVVAGINDKKIEKALEKTGGQLNFTGKQFGVFRFKYQGDEVEIAMPRVEKSTGAGHRDFKVDYDHKIPIETDLGRRDFTANAMAYDLNTGQLIDPYGGQADIQTQTLRLVNPNAFKDDPLRIVRAIVAYAKHGLYPDEQTEAALQESADKVRNLPGERIQAELDKLLAAPDPATAIELAYRSGVLDYILPEVSSAMGFDQHNRFHDLDVGSHLLAVLRAMSQISNDPDMRLAALLHDIGKPDSFWQDATGAGHFYEHPDYPNSANHEELGADMGAELMRRLRYPEDRVKRVETLIRMHMFPYFESEKGARKLLNAVEGDSKMAMDLMKLRESDARGKRDGQLNQYDSTKIPKNVQWLQNAIDKQDATTVRDLALNGSDLIALGMQPGPEIGIVLKKLLDLVVEDPSLNQKDILTQKAKEIIDAQSS